MRHAEPTARMRPSGAYSISETAPSVRLSIPFSMPSSMMLFSFGGGGRFAKPPRSSAGSGSGAATARRQRGASANGAPAASRCTESTSSSHGLQPTASSEPSCEKQQQLAVLGSRVRKRQRRSASDQSASTRSAPPVTK